jgi:hypothetical protein
VRSVRVGVAGCWVVLLACGGVTQGHGDDDGNGGSAAGGSAANNSRSGSASHAGRPATAGSTSAAGTASAGSTSAAGTASAGAASAGAATTTPDPPVGLTACFNDSDCPVNRCGGQVCNWTRTAQIPVGDKAFACNAAGSQQPVGKDGWCTTDADCKCANLGAKCIAPYCSFTRPEDAP